jgi:PTH1 family peptidyl-tRNA hydrolase
MVCEDLITDQIFPNIWMIFFASSQQVYTLKLIRHTIDLLLMNDNNLERIFNALRGLTHQKSKAHSEQVESYSSTYLIVGLGNPGREYRNTKHNVGFMLADRLADRMKVRFTRSQSKALVTNGRLQDNRIILAKPQTYMNKSGHPIQALLKFYKLTLEYLLVAYDDVDLPFDTIRLKPSGGSAGHKGMRSIIEQLGTDNFPRLRMGIGRPPGSKQAADYVLKPFSKDENDFLEVFLNRAADAALSVITHGMDYAMSKYN